MDKVVFDTIYGIRIIWHYDYMSRFHYEGSFAMSFLCVINIMFEWFAWLCKKQDVTIAYL